MGLAQALENAGDLEDALAEVASLLAATRDLTPCDASLRSVRSQQRRFAEATIYFQTALELAPKLSPTHHGYGLHLLRLGQLAEGWRHVRMSLPDSAAPAPQLGAEALAGKHVVVHGDQGVGDEIRSASCYPDLLDAASRFTSYCEPRLKPLFERSFARGHFVPLGRQEKAPPAVAVRMTVLLASDFLPAYFRADFAGFPARQAHLKADPELCMKRRQRLRATRPGMWVGISWWGGAPLKDRRARTVALRQRRCSRSRASIS